jgi:hypothetical protein
MEQRTNKKIRNIKFYLKAFFLFLLFVMPFLGAHAATLMTVPATASHPVAEVFSVAISVNSNGAAINAVSGTLLYPNDVLQVISLSKASSIMNFWVTEPSFSTASGKIHFEGIVLNPGYKGSSGTILTVTFKGKKEGIASLSFQSSSVLANDGEGTNVLSATSKGTYTITPLLKKPEETPTTEAPVTPEPIPETPTLPSNVTLVPKEELESPVITEYPEYARSGEFLVVRGVTYPNMRVIISLKERQKSTLGLGHVLYVADDYAENVVKTIVKSNQNGEFTYVSKTRLTNGSYDLWAEAFADNGDKSKPTDKISVTVYQTLFLRFGSSLVQVLVVVVPLIALIIVLILLLRYMWKKLRRFYARMREDSRETESIVDRSFSVLKDDMTMIEQVPHERISAREKVLLSQHKKDLDTAANLIERNIEKMRRDIPPER